MLQNVGLELQYKTCYARVLDSKRKFLQAATQYYELSQVENVQSGPGQASAALLTCPRLATASIGVVCFETCCIHVLRWERIPQITVSCLLYRLTRGKTHSQIKTLWKSWSCTAFPC